MSLGKRGSRSFVVAALLLTATLGGSAIQPAAGSHNPVTAVTGSAYGYSFVGTFGGGAPQSSGPDPTVTLPATGGDQSVTDPDGATVLIGGVALIYQSGATTVSSNGTTGVGGNVTSSSRVLGYQDPAESPSDPAGDGPDPFTWQDLRGDCTASAAGATATTSVAMGVVVTSTDPRTGDPASSVNVPANPAPNTVINGSLNHVDATFSVTFNEQSTANGVLTLTAAHMRFLTGPLLGDLWIGRAVCGVTADAAAHAPVARDDTYSTPYQTILDVAAPGVIANDSDEDGGALTAALVAGPANGAVTLNADGSFRYTPVAGFSGPDSFTYQASDGALTSNVATVAVTVGPRPASADVSVTITDSTDPVATRSLLTYTIAVVNGGPDPAAQVTAQIGLPAGSRLQSYSGATCTEMKGKMRGLACDLGTMGVEASRQIVVTITAPTKPSTLTATASASSTTSDPNPANNSDSEQTVVVVRP